jgi:PUA domain protein
MRRRLRKKEAKKIINEVYERSGVMLSGEMDVVDVDSRKIILVDGEPILIEHEGKWYLTVFGAIKYKPARWKVMVDSGALPYIMNGADVMRPGIVYADPEIKEGDFVFITVEEKDTPIAIGKALVDGKDMLGDKGKVILNIHHLKDRIWNFFFKSS